MRLAILALCLSAVLAGCTPSIVPPVHTIYFSQCVGSDLWRRQMLAEMKMELSFHPGVEFVYTDAENDSRVQADQIARMLKERKIDVLIVSPNEAKPLTPVVENAYNNGIPVILIDRKTASDQYSTFIGTDNYVIGRMAAGYLGESAHGPLSVVEVLGLAGSSPTIERDRGFRDGLAAYPNIHLVRRVRGNWLTATTEDSLWAVRGSLAGVDAVFAQNDNMGSGARTILNRVCPGRRVRVIGVDALPGQGGGMEMIGNKVLDASLVYPTFGKEAIITACRMLDHEPVPKVNMLQSLVVDSGNVQVMNMQYNKIIGQQDLIERQQQLMDRQRSIYRGQQTVLDVIILSLVLAVVFGGVAFASLRQNIKINRRLKVQKGELVDMSARAQAATEARLNFFTNVSHELRTPLTLILSPLSDIIDSERLTSAGRQNIQLIQQNSHRLMKIVNQLIDYRKVEIDKQTITASHNNLVEYVLEIVNSFSSHARRNGVHLHFQAAERDIPVWFDTQLLDKVFFNLVSNAIKFTREDGSVVVRVERLASEAVVRVTDNGIGMTEEECARAFDLFYQADHAPMAGSGIGLSLSKEIVRLHHGSITVDSEKWKGTTFSVVLPLGDTHLSAFEKGAPVPRNAQELAVFQGDLEPVSSPAPGFSFESPKELTILLIEDNEDLLQYLRERFSASFDVIVSRNGNDGLTQAYEYIPDVIVSDVVLPGQSGKTIASALKSDFRTSHIPIVLLTAQASVEQQISGLDAMADLYITKPFQFEYLAAAVQNLIRNRSLLKKHFAADVPQTSISNRLDKKFLNDLTGIVEQHLSDDQFGIDDICRLIGISKMQLYRKAKALLGTSVSEYILMRRIKEAQTLLAAGELSVAEVTYKVGFSNPNYFSTVFKGKCGVSPTEYRRAHGVR